MNKCKHTHCYIDNFVLLRLKAAFNNGLGSIGAVTHPQRMLTAAESLWKKDVKGESVK